MINEARYLRNTIKHDMNRFKQTYYLNLMEQNKEDPKKFWTTLHDLLNNQKSSGISAVRDPSTNLLLNTSESAEMLNEYFSNIAES